MAQRKPDRVVDLRDVACPGSYVQALAVMEEESPGQVIEFWVANGTAVMDIPRFMREAGHQVVQLRQLDDDHCAIAVLRGSQ